MDPAPKRRLPVPRIVALIVKMSVKGEASSLRPNVAIQLEFASRLRLPCVRPV